MTGPSISWPRLFLRWLFGMTLITWRYVWSISVLHRSQHEHDFGRREAPPLPPALVDDGLLLVEQGAGPRFHRLFRVHVVDGRWDATELMRHIVTDFGQFVPHEVVAVVDEDPSPGALRPGDEIVVDMPGPWNGPVRVVATDHHSLRLATMQGHLEAGQIEFRTAQADGAVVLEVEAWARPSSRLVDLLYSRVRLAKEVQLNMWVRFCQAAAKRSGGRVRDGIEIHTHPAR